MMSHQMFLKTSEIACLMKETNHYPEMTQMRKHIKHTLKKPSRTTLLSQAKRQLGLLQVDKQLMSQTQCLTIHICCQSPAWTRSHYTHYSQCTQCSQGPVYTQYTLEVQSLWSTVLLTSKYSIKVILIYKETLCETLCFHCRIVMQIC